jgi:pimeloyl-ACP methyl ester carboxylesterase
VKGVIITKFLEFVEEQYSADLVDDLLDGTDLPYGGVYTSVGTYSAGEMTALLDALSVRTGLSVRAVLLTYGAFVFSRLAASFPELVDRDAGMFAFLTTIPAIHHDEVVKIYPDAQLPSFEVAQDGDVVTIRYSSPRRLADFAEGLLAGVCSYFDEAARIERRDVEADGSVVQFTLTRVTA